MKAVETITAIHPKVKPVSLLFQRARNGNTNVGRNAEIQTKQAMMSIDGPMSPEWVNLKLRYAPSKRKVTAKIADDFSQRCSVVSGELVIFMVIVGAAFLCQPAALRLTSGQTAVARCPYQTDRPLLGQRAMERAQLRPAHDVEFVVLIVDLYHRCAERTRML